MDVLVAILGISSTAALAFGLYWFAYRRRYVMMWLTGLMTACAFLVLGYVRVLFLMGGGN